jgi:serine/threonine protein kinase
MHEDCCATNNASVWRDYETTGKVLGQGGLSTNVLEAAHKVTGELVAIKTLEREKLSLRHRIDLNREVETQASLDHPHVARLKAVYKSKKHVRLVVEHLSGGTVSRILKDKGVFSESEAALVVKQVLEAVKYLHLKACVEYAACSIATDIILSTLHLRLLQL